MLNKVTYYNKISDIPKIINSLNINKLFLVCGHKSYDDNKELNSIIDSLKINHVRFSEFTSNPKYEEVSMGVEYYNDNNCDGILAIGGGSAIDVAKCIKLFFKMDTNKNYLDQPKLDTIIPLVAIPTTAGTGSEATHFAVIYYGGDKFSVAHSSILPDSVILDSNLLDSLSLYQKKSTLMDALCHSIESLWAVAATKESIEYSKTSISKILLNYKSYLNNPNEKINHEIMEASNLAGKAINITKTTAAHAMSYKLTSLFNIAHGHAVALCLPFVWEFMANELVNPNSKIEQSLKSDTKNKFKILNNLFLTSSSIDSINKLKKMLLEMELSAPQKIDDNQIKTLVDSVNIERLKNNPLKLEKEDLTQIYSNIFR